MKHNNEMSQTQAVTLGLMQALTEPNDRLAQKAADMAESIAGGLTDEQLEACKSAALEMAEGRLGYTNEKCHTQVLTQAYVCALIAQTGEQLDHATELVKSVQKDATKAGLTGEQAKACRAAAIEIVKKTYPDLAYLLDGIKP